MPLGAALLGVRLLTRAQRSVNVNNGLFTVMRTLFVTSTNRELFRAYAHHFFTTFPHREYDLVVYTEDQDHSWIPHWVKHTHHIPTEDPEIWRRRTELQQTESATDYRSTPSRWVPKVATLRLAVHTYSLWTDLYSATAWIDADCVFSKAMPTNERFTLQMRRYAKPILIHNRTHAQMPYPESGFIWFDSQSYMPGVREWDSTYPHAPTLAVNLLREKWLDNAILVKQAGHDAYQWGEILTKTPLLRNYWGDLSGPYHHKPHPQRNSVTAAYWTHRKGKAKHTKSTNSTG